MKTKLIQFFTTFFALVLVCISFSPLFTPQSQAYMQYLAIGNEVEIDDRGHEVPEPDRGHEVEVAFPNITEVDDVCDLITKFVDFVVQIGAIVAVLFMIWAGFLFIKAQGKPEELKKAKNTFWTTVIGIAILLGASVITKIIVNTVMSITGDSISICRP